MMMNNEYMVSHERQVCEKEPYDIITALEFWIPFGNFTKAHNVGETKVGLLHEEWETRSWEWPQHRQESGDSFPSEIKEDYISNCL